ncbi:hypothetical protein HAX54_041790, partial [Datura stramonium]|nr:hypothetical protein [Datura stramonium]
LALKFTIFAIPELCFSWAILAFNLSSLAVASYYEIISASLRGFKAISMAKMKKINDLLIKLFTYLSTLSTFMAMLEKFSE